MARDWTSAQQIAQLGLSIMYELAKEFHIEASKPSAEKDHNLMIKLSQAVGYQTQLFTSLQKNHEFAKRLVQVEAQTQIISPEDLAYKHNPALMAEQEKEKELEQLI